MGRLVINCTDADLQDRERLEELLLDAAEEGFTCNIEYYEQAQEMIEASSATSERDAARRIAELTGEPFDTVRTRIERGKKDSGLSVSPVGGRPTKLQQKREKTSDNAELSAATYHAEKLSDAFANVLLNDTPFILSTEKDAFNLQILRGFAPAIIRAFQYCSIDVEKVANITNIKPLGLCDIITVEE
jgi:hypothetical protein